jgi:hypothetical protein
MPRSGNPESITTIRPEIAQIVIMDFGFAGFRPRPGMTSYIDFNKLSAPEISALPGASSTLSVFTTPSSTTMA